MEKIKNGDIVLYKNLEGTIYGKPRENKFKGLLYTVKIGDEYFKASASELSLVSDAQPLNNEATLHDFQIFNSTERR